MPDIQGIQIDPDELAAVKIAILDAVKDFTYDGIKIASVITDAEITQVATAAVAAGQNYRNAPAI